MNAPEGPSTFGASVEVNTDGFGIVGEPSPNAANAGWTGERVISARVKSEIAFDWTDPRFQREFLTKKLLHEHLNSNTRIDCATVLKILTVDTRIVAHHPATISNRILVAHYRDNKDFDRD